MSKPYRLEFVVPGLPPMANPSGRSSTHWRRRKAETDAWKTLIGWHLKQYAMPTAPLKRARLTLTRCSLVAPDGDGLVSGFKAIIDALVSYGVLENDRLKNIGVPDYQWEPAKPKQGQIKIVVESSNEGETTT